MLSVDALGCNEDVERTEKINFDKMSPWFAGIRFLVYVADFTGGGYHQGGFEFGCLSVATDSFCCGFEFI